MTDELNTESQHEEFEAPETSRTPDDDILDEAFELLNVSDSDESPASRSDVDGAEFEKDSESTSGQTPVAGRSHQQNAGNKHSVQNRINFFKRLAAESDERADAFRLQLDGAQRDNESLRGEIKHLEALMSDLQEQMRTMARSNFDYDGVDAGNNSGGVVNKGKPVYRDNDDNRPMTVAEFKKLSEQRAQQQSSEERFQSLLSGWVPHLEKAKKRANADVVDLTFKNFLRDAKGRPGMIHAAEIIKDLDHPLETLTALTCLPGYRNMTPAQIAANVTRLNLGVVSRKNRPTGAKPIQELKGGAARKEREPQSYAEYKAAKRARAST